MNDKQSLIRICERLGLTRNDSADPCAPGETEFLVRDSEGDRSEVRIGSGKHGYNGFYAVFTFDAADNAVEHGIWE